MVVGVKVFLNRQTDDDGRLAIFSRFGLGGVYQEGDDLELVATLNIGGDTVDQVLNRTFAATNRGSGSFVGDEVYAERSLSAGDVLEVLGVRYAVEGVGFRRLEEVTA